MTFDLNQLAEGRFLNKKLLQIFVGIKSKERTPEYFWYNENGYGDYLGKHLTNTWHCDKLVEEFKEFCEPKNLLKAIILDRTFIRGIELEYYSKEFEYAIDDIIEIYQLENKSRQIPEYAGSKK